MEEKNLQSAKNTTPQRIRRTKQELFKENSLPVIILGVALVLILVFIIGSISRGVQKKNIEKEASIAVSESIAAEEARLAAEAESILANAEQLASCYDYEGAIALINSFSGNIGGYPELQDAQARFEYAQQSLVVWEDPNTITNLSFQTLIADTKRAFSHKTYKNALKKNFVTTKEFETILERLYANDYILVSLDDFITTGTSDNGTTYYTYKELRLPEGKKPLVLTQTNVNYNQYLIDSNKDMVADKGGVGIASRLVLDDNGKVTCEMVDAEGNTLTGAYDLIPILDAFVEAHPDFSYKNAKAVLALTGYNGLFGYRTDPDGRKKFGEEEYAKNVETVQKIAETLKASGYDLACYTYGNSAYGKFSLSQIQKEMNKWNEEVVPILGQIEIMVFAQNSDIKSSVLYSGSKYKYLKSIGFNYYLGFCSEGDPFTFIADDYVRQGRLLVTGGNIKNNPKWFNAIFDTKDLLVKNH